MFLSKAVITCFGVLLAACAGAFCAPVLRILPLGPAAQDTLDGVVARIGSSCHVAVISFVPGYPVDLTALKTLDPKPDRAVAQLAAAIDGHVEQVSDLLYLIEPNFRVDSPSSPLVPRVRAVVQATYGLAEAFADIPPDLRVDAIGKKGGVSLSSLSLPARSDMARILIQGRPFNEALFGAASGRSLSISFRPELLVNVRCGGVRLGSFDAWEQRDNDSIGWDYNSSVDSSALDAPSLVPTPVPAESVSIPMTSHFVKLAQGHLRAKDLPDATRQAGVGLIVDTDVASRSVAVTGGVYESQVLVESVCKCLQLRPLAVTDPAGAQPQYVLTGPLPTDDQRLANDAVDREISIIWSPVIAAVGSARATDFSPFPLADFARFMTIPYDGLSETQKACIDQLLSLISTQLTEQQRRHIMVILRPGLIAQGRADGELRSTIEETATIYSDVAR